MPGEVENKQGGKWEARCCEIWQPFERGVQKERLIATCPNSVMAGQIVREHNAHGELVEACERVLSDAKEWSGFVDVQIDEHDFVYVQDALSTARGER